MSNQLFDECKVLPFAKVTVLTVMVTSCDAYSSRGKEGGRDEAERRE